MRGVSTAAVGAAALLLAPATMIAGPAHADGPEKKREFRLAGAEVDFSVEKDDGRFEVEVDIDDARPGTKWRVVLRHDATRRAPTRSRSGSRRSAAAPRGPPFACGDATTSRPPLADCLRGPSNGG